MIARGWRCSRQLTDPPIRERVGQGGSTAVLPRRHARSVSETRAAGGRISARRKKWHCIAIIPQTYTQPVNGLYCGWRGFSSISAAATRRTSTVASTAWRCSPHPFSSLARDVAPRVHPVKRAAGTPAPTAAARRRAMTSALRNRWTSPGLMAYGRMRHGGRTPGSPRSARSLHHLERLRDVSSAPSGADDAVDDLPQAVSMITVSRRGAGFRAARQSRSAAAARRRAARIERLSGRALDALAKSVEDSTA